MNAVLAGPYPWAGGKSLIASDVWAHIGPCPVVVEPFFGGGSLLLARPVEGITRGSTEIVNDLDNFVVNFWRSLQLRHAELCDWLDYPVSEVDLTARHRWLQREGLAKLAALDWEGDPMACDPQVAAWWAWGQSQWIGGGWCAPTTTARRRPKTTLNGVCRRVDLPTWLEALAHRLRFVQVWRGDWKRCVTDAVLNDVNGSVTAILLDPPYSQAHRSHRKNSPLYAVDTDPAAEVREWCLANGHRARLRIALFGLEGEGHEALEAQGWTVKAWTARGMSNQGHDTPNKTRRHLERVWFSPACLKPNTDKIRPARAAQLTLLDSTNF